MQLFRISSSKGFFFVPTREKKLFFSSLSWHRPVNPTKHCQGLPCCWFQWIYWVWSTLERLLVGIVNAVCPHLVLCRLECKLKSRTKEKKKSELRTLTVSKPWHIMTHQDSSVLPKHKTVSGHVQFWFPGFKSPHFNSSMVSNNDGFSLSAGGVRFYRSLCQQPQLCWK